MGTPSESEDDEESKKPQQVEAIAMSLVVDNVRRELAHDRLDRRARREHAKEIKAIKARVVVPYCSRMGPTAFLYFFLGLTFSFPQSYQTILYVRHMQPADVQLMHAAMSLPWILKTFVAIGIDRSKKHPIVFAQGMLPLCIMTWVIMLLAKDDSFSIIGMLISSLLVCVADVALDGLMVRRVNSKYFQMSQDKRRRKTMFQLQAQTALWLAVGLVLGAYIGGSVMDAFGDAAVQFGQILIFSGYLAFTFLAVNPQEDIALAGLREARQRADRDLELAISTPPSATHELPVTPPLEQPLPDRPLPPPLRRMDTTQAFSMEDEGFADEAGPEHNSVQNAMESAVLVEAVGDDSTDDGGAPPTVSGLKMVFHDKTLFKLLLLNFFLHAVPSFNGLLDTFLVTELNFNAMHLGILEMFGSFGFLLGSALYVAILPDHHDSKLERRGRMKQRALRAQPAPRWKQFFRDLTPSPRILLAITMLLVVIESATIPTGLLRGWMNVIGISAPLWAAVGGFMRSATDRMLINPIRAAVLPFCSGAGTDSTTIYSTFTSVANVGSIASMALGAFMSWAAGIRTGNMHTLWIMYIVKSAMFLCLLPLVHVLPIEKPPPRTTTVTSSSSTAEPTTQRPRSNSIDSYVNRVVPE